MNELERKYLGKHLLVGLTYLDADQRIREQVKLHGNIVEISENTIVFKRNDNNENFSIPFDEDNIEEVDPALIYTLRSTGEAVKSVNYLSSWTIHSPQEAK